MTPLGNGGTPPRSSNPAGMAVSISAGSLTGTETWVKAGKPSAGTDLVLNERLDRKTIEAPVLRSDNHHHHDAQGRLRTLVTVTSQNRWQ